MASGNTALLTQFAMAKTTEELDGVGYYVADYKAEDLNKNDFVFSVDEGSKLYGTDLADLFYFVRHPDIVLVA